MSACQLISEAVFLTMRPALLNGPVLRARRTASCRLSLKQPDTVDQGIPHQQSFARRKLSIILIRSRTNQIEDLLPLVDAILQALELVQPGQTVTIPSSD